MWQASSRITLTKTSKVGERNWGYEKIRHQLQIYTPPLDHCTSLKPEAASSGSVSVPAHTGCTRAHTLIYLCCRFECLPPPREMGANEIYARMSGNSFFWGKRTCNSSEGKERLSLPSYVSNHTEPPIHSRTAESVMDAHRYIVSKYTSVSVGALFCNCSI